jgi:hypothetical protein
LAFLAWGLFFFAVAGIDGGGQVIQPGKLY